MNRITLCLLFILAFCYQHVFEIHPCCSFGILVIVERCLRRSLLLGRATSGWSAHLLLGARVVSSTNGRESRCRERW